MRAITPTIVPITSGPKCISKITQLAAPSTTPMPVTPVKTPVVPAMTPAITTDTVNNIAAATAGERLNQPPIMPATNGPTDGSHANSASAAIVPTTEETNVI